MKLNNQIQFLQRLRFHVELRHAVPCLTPASENLFPVITISFVVLLSDARLLTTEANSNKFVFPDPAFTTNIKFFNHSMKLVL